MTTRSLQILAALGALATAVYFSRCWCQRRRGAVTHMVTFKVKKGTSEEDIKRLMESRERLKDIPVVRSIEAYRDLGLDPERNHHLMFLVTFDTIEDYKTYSAHPVHIEVLKTILLPVLEPGSRE